MLTSLSSVCLLLSFSSFFAPTTVNGSPDFQSNFLSLAKDSEIFDWMVRVRRTLHENPELGYEEFETSKFIRSELDGLGIKYTHPLAVTGLVGIVGTGKPPFVALRADMDALTIQEAVDWEHKSKIPGKMHACGHDAHTTMLLGAARLLQMHRDELKGTVLLVFQPAEEGLAGAKKMVETGILNNVSAIFGFHVDPRKKLGEAHGRPGSILAGSGCFEAVVTGKGGHAAIPQLSIDPILAASNVVVSLQHLVSREADPLDSQVVTVATFQGGGAFNVIPDQVTIGGTFRAFSRESFDQLRQRIEEVVVAQASVQRCSATVRFATAAMPFIPPAINDEGLHRFFEEVARGVLGKGKVKEMTPLMGSEDFSFYQERMPGYIYFLGMRDDEMSELSPPHTPLFEVNERVLSYGAALHASLAAVYLDRHGVVPTEQHDEL